ncbi:MAG: IS21 family transposase [Gammaproteobacteria bacterium]
MRKLREILRLKHEAKLPHRAIARACAVGVSTVYVHVKRAQKAGLTWPLPEELDDAALEARLFRRAAPLHAPHPLPDLWALHQELKRPGVTLHLLWLEYIESHPEGYRYSQFCEQYRRWTKKLHPAMRQRHRAGEKVFVDYSGKKLHLLDQCTGELLAVELFVGVLGASGLIYAEATRTQTLFDWIGSHIRMLEYFGGSPAIFVADNLKSAVTRACRYEPEVNRTYQELARFYGAVVIPARARKPKDKAKAESGVLLAQRGILAVLRHHHCFSLPELNAAMRTELERLNSRPMKKLGVSRRALFEQLERPALKALPSVRFEMGQWKTSRVNIDYHIEIERNYYSVPYSLVHEEVEARFTASIVEVYFKGRRIASHPRLHGRGQPSTDPAHMPRAHRAHAEWSASRLIHWAAKNGLATAGVVAEILAGRAHPEQGYRACLGLMRLGRQYGEQRLEAACTRAIRLGAYSYRSVKNILSSGLDRVPLEETAFPPINPMPAHDNIRGAAYYASEEKLPC